MTKKIVTLAVLMACMFTVSAQKLGVIAGYSLSNDFVSENTHQVDFGARPGSGFHVGALFEWDFTNRWGLEASAQYTMRSYHFDMRYDSDTSTIFNRQLFYFDLPIHAYVNFPIGKTVVSIFAGPSLGVGLHGKDIGWFNTADKKPKFLESEELYGPDNRVTYCEIAADLGLAVKYQNYQVRVSYQIGLNNTTLQDYNWSFDLDSSVKKSQHQGVFKLSFVYLFDLRK